MNRKGEKYMWKLEIKDDNYNRLYFDFEDLNEAGAFAAKAICTSECQLKIKITLENEEENEEE